MQGRGRMCSEGFANPWRFLIDPDPAKLIHFPSVTLPSLSVSTLLSISVLAGGSQSAMARSGDDSELKVAVWMDSDRFTVEIARLQANSDLFFIKISATVGVNTVYGKQIVNYIPV